MQLKWALVFNKLLISDVRILDNNYLETIQRAAFNDSEIGRLYVLRNSFFNWLWLQSSFHFAEVWKGTKSWGIFTNWPSKASTTFDNCEFDEYSLNDYVITRKLYFYSTRDLSGTSIESLPSTGLDKLEELRIQNTQSLKHIPSVYNFKVLLLYPVWDSAIHDKVL